MRYLFVLAFFCISMTWAGAQTLLYDDFNDPGNPNGWEVIKADTVAKVFRDGKYLLSHKPEKGFLVALQSLQIDTRRDFEISTSMEFLGGDKVDGHGLLYGYESDRSYQRFAISSTGWYSIGSKEEGTYVVIQKWTKSPHIKQGEGVMNDLKVVKKGPDMHYYINGVEVFSNIYKEFAGDQTGLIVYYDHDAAADFFKVEYLSGEEVRPGEAKKTKLMIEDFSSNFRNWYTGSSEAGNVYLKDGKYHIDYKSEGQAAVIDYRLGIDESRDFEFRAMIQKVAGPENNPYGIAWGRLDGDNNYNFVIIDEGKFGIYYNANGQIGFIKEVTVTPLINRSRESGVSAYNELMIRKVGDRMKFYINNTEVYSADFRSFYGNKIGIAVENEIHIAVDYLYVYYLD